MKAILVNDDRSLRWDDVPNPIMNTEDCLVVIEAFATGYLNLFMICYNNLAVKIVSYNNQ